MSKIIVKDLAGPASSSNKIYIASGSELDIANSSGTINLAVDAGDIASGTLGTGRFPSDSIVFTQFAEISTDGTITADGGASFVDATGFTITVASADAAKCSKLIVTFVSGFRVNQATYTFGEARIQRSAPSRS